MIQERAHIQHFEENSTTVYYWGYGPRIVPCTNDAGSCEYLDAVYWMHTVHMLYSWILWVVIGGILLLFFILPKLKPRARKSKSVDPESSSSSTQGGLFRTYRALAATARRHLLPEVNYWPFKGTTRLQLAILAVGAGYLLIFSLVGIVYKTWITPVSGTNLYNRRTGIGGFADRVGVFAYALTPLTIMLASRESVLSLITGVPAQHFMFLHRWSGRIIFAQSFLHTLGWTLVEGLFYQPQPSTYYGLIQEEYIIYGIVAMTLLTFLYVFSTGWAIRWTGYEFFRKSHWVVAALYIGACWGHWKLLKCWMIASLIVLFFDIFARAVRTLLIHLRLKDGENGLGFQCAAGELELVKDEEDDAEVAILRFEQRHAGWRLGQHFYLCFPELSIWQSHPFTPSLPPSTKSYGTQKHLYIIRAMEGETKRLAKLVADRSSVPSTPQTSSTSSISTPDQKKPEVVQSEMNLSVSTPVILTGPFGAPVLDNSASAILTIAGGTGVSFTLPFVLSALDSESTSPIGLVWVVRRTKNMQWITPELETIFRAIETKESNRKIFVRILVTRDESVNGFSGINFPSSSPAFQISHSTHKEIDFSLIMSEFNDFCGPEHGARVQVLASGPKGMGTDLRCAVAGANQPGRVMKGDSGKDWSLYWDAR